MLKSWNYSGDLLEADWNAKLRATHEPVRRQIDALLDEYTNTQMCASSTRTVRARVLVTLSIP